MKIADMHCDTISKLYDAYKKGEKTSLRENSMDIDLQKLKKGGYLLQNFAVFLDLKESPEPYQKAVSMILLFQQELEKNKEMIRQVFSYEDIVTNMQENRISAMLTLEEGEICEGDPGKLENLYQMGARMLTLSWNHNNSLGFPNLMPEEKRDKCEKWYTYPETERGLTELGITFVQKMNELGMIVDVSHMSDAGFYDVAKYSTKPFVASHSNARTVCPWVRNLTDDMIRTLAEHGGVMGLNFCMDFLRYPQDEENYMDAMVAHAKHIVNVGGIEVLGFGTDFDGIDRNRDIPDASCMPQLVRKLEQAGFTGNDLDKILYQNVLRVYREVL